MHFLTSLLLPFLFIGQVHAIDIKCDLIKDKAKRSECRQKIIQKEREKLSKTLEKLKSGNLTDAQKKKELDYLSSMITLKEEQIKELQSLVAILKEQKTKVNQIDVKKKAMELHKARKAKLKKIKN